MYASPLRDGGYDIADFYAIHPDYGTIEDVRALHRRRPPARHPRDRRPRHEPHLVATTRGSRSRARAPDNPKRDWYVWSDTDERYADARIIFIDTETSNWTWDQEAGAYYWHRFFSHQPDLNYDNPEVQEAMLDVAALLAGPRPRRLPPRRRALPVRARGHQLREPRPRPTSSSSGCARRSTRSTPTACCSPRPTSGPRTSSSTSATATSATWPSTSRSCRACSWRCAARRRRRSTRSSTRTPEIPDNCQWGLFLRNHDELTLEMVTDEERDYMYAEYAKDPRMKINVGIRRRLAPLLDNGRDEMELHARDPVLAAGLAGPLLRRRDRDGRQRLPRRPRRRAHADAVDRRPQRRLLARRLRAALRAAADGPGLRLPGGQRRGPAAHADVAAALAAALHRAAQGAPRVRPRHLRAADAEQPEDLRPHPHATRTTSRSACTTSRAPRRRWSSTCRAYEGRSPVEMFGRTRFPRDRRAAVPAHARAARLLLVPAARTGARAGRAEPADAAGRHRSTSGARRLARRRSAGSRPSRATSPSRLLERARAARRAAARARARRGALPGRDARALPAAARLRPAARAAERDRRGRRLDVYDALADARGPRELLRDARRATSRPTRAVALPLRPARRWPADADVRPMGAEQSNSSIVVRRARGAEGVPAAGAGRRTRSSRCCASSPSAASRTSRRCAGWYDVRGRAARRDARRRRRSSCPTAATAGSWRSRARSDPERVRSSASRARRGHRRRCTPCSARTPPIPDFAPEEPGDEALVAADRDDRRGDRAGLPRPARRRRRARADRRPRRGDARAPADDVARRRRRAS